MMHRSLLCLSAARTAAGAYLDYLQAVDKELLPLHDIFPKSSAVSDVVEFHSALCTVMEENAYPLVGIKVLPPTCEAVTALRGTRPMCVPIFSNLFQRTGLSVAKDRLQHVDAAICIHTTQLVDGCDTVEGAKSNATAFAPGIEVSGSRFPFYAPTLSGLACDLGGCVSIVKGRDVAFAEAEVSEVSNRRFVLTHNQEPIQVGVGKQCMESPFAAVVSAAEYAKAMKAPRNRDLYVFCGGVCSRSPVQAGTYAFEWGRLGRLTHTVLP